MTSYIIHPEVAGGFGTETILDPSVHPPVIQRLHYEFSGWSGDDIVESFPCFIVSEALAHAISETGLSGVRFADVLVTKDVQFERFSPEIASTLPSWKWLQPVGVPNIDDFWQDETARLCVSDRAYAVLSGFCLKAAEISEI
jgi:hypothetical protein